MVDELAELKRRINARILTAKAAWEESKPASRLSNSGGRKNGDGYFLGIEGGLREALLEINAVARIAGARGAVGSGAIRR